MKKLVLITSLTCFALWHNSTQGATKYWDIDGATPGAGGATPSGLWDTSATPNWTTSAAGSSAGTTWASGDDAVFSAGTDATGAFTITLDNTASPPVQNAGNLTVEEGNATIASDPGVYLNIGGGVAGKGIITVSNGASVTISAELDSVYGILGDNTGQLTKTGTGTLTMSAANFDGAIRVVKEGVLVAANATALGNTLLPTIVSNGATLEVKGSCGEDLTLSGNGFNGVGALRQTSSDLKTKTGQTILGSDATITVDTSGEWRWNHCLGVDGTNAGGVYSVTFAGNGGTTRLNNACFPGRAIILNNAPVYKEGSHQLRFEVPTIGVSAFYFNGGTVMTRTAANGNFLPGGSPCYVGVNAVGFDTGGAASPAIYTPMLLDTGANLQFIVRLSNGGVPQSWTQTGVISGAGSLTKVNVGTLFLNAHHTYSGNTTIEDGNLTLGATGSISNSPVIDVQGANAVFNVTSNASFVLEATQTLKGNGTNWGNIIANGTIAPGASVGTLTFDNNLTLNGNLLIEVDKNQSPANDVINVHGTVNNTGSGTVTVNRIGGAALQVGDNFPIFNQAVSGAQTMSVVGAGATWTNKLWVDGSIEVLVAPGPDLPATNVTAQVVGPTSISLGGMGSAGTPYDVYGSPDVTLPMTSWTLLGSTIADGGGVIQYLDSQATNVQYFYRFALP